MAEDNEQIAAMAALEVAAGTVNRQVARFETTAVFTHPDAKADIVLVHGLNGDPSHTWTAKNGVFWPVDLLPDALRDVPANVLVYGYNADVFSKRHSSGGPSSNFILQHAQTLVTSLTLYRQSEGSANLPIVWVAHSLGGILVKRALLYSNDLRAREHEDYRGIYVSTYGIVFLGTPHDGSDLAWWGGVLQAMSDAVVPRRVFQSESVLLRTLKKDNEILQNINVRFLDIYQRFKIMMAHENHKTDVKGTKVLIVDSLSAGPPLAGVLYYGIEATHSGMVKFDGPNAPGFRSVSTAIREWIRAIGDTVETRWKIEEQERMYRTRNEVSELMKPYLLPSSDAPTSDLQRQSHDGGLVPSIPAPGRHGQVTLPSIPGHAKPLPPPLLSASPDDGPDTVRVPLFIHPDKFRPNAFFKGREHELAELHRLLMDPERRRDGTSAVVIQSLPGGGKSHLARQYVYQHRNDYPGGIYWVQARMVQEMEDGFWRIARSEALRELVGQARERDLRDPAKMVSLVVRWLNSFSHWLLVLDGIQFDMQDVERFVPDARQTSLIFTSTQGAAVGGRHRLDSPRVMELGLLSETASSELLLEEMEKRKPWTADDRSRALEAVQLMGRLPLMIHAAAQHLKATREPLAKYIKSYKDRPKVGLLPAYMAVREQLHDRGETAALNLLYVLSFFSQRLPVEMLVLGLRALDKRTPVRSRGSVPSAKKNLTNTLQVLIAFALIDRDEIDDVTAGASSPSSPAGRRVSTDLANLATMEETLAGSALHSSSSSSSPSPSHPLDVIHMHSIVQAFFVETLAAERQLPFWLERAAAVFCRSYDEGELRMAREPDTGLPDDYRRYATHGRELLDHIERVDKKPRELLAAREELKLRLNRISTGIEQLTREISDNIIRGQNTGRTGGRIPHASLFQREYSSSQPDSAETSQQDSDTRGDDIFGHHATYTTGFPETTTTMTPGGRPIGFPGPNPYHYHVPYPPYPPVSTIPALPFVDEDDDNGPEDPIYSVTPRQPQGPLDVVEMPDTPPTSIRSHHYNNHHHHNPTHHSNYPPHRAIKRLEGRRYRDRAGAWRDTIHGVSDPRVSISREVARGKFAETTPAPVVVSATGDQTWSPTPPGGGVSAMDRLEQIKNASSTTATATGPTQGGADDAAAGGRLRSFSGGSSFLRRPWSLLMRGSDGEKAKAVTVSDDDSLERQGAEEENRVVGTSTGLENGSLAMGGGGGDGTGQNAENVVPTSGAPVDLGRHSQDAPIPRPPVVTSPISIAPTKAGAYAYRDGDGDSNGNGISVSRDQVSRLTGARSSPGLRPGPLSSPDQPAAARQSPRRGDSLAVRKYVHTSHDEYHDLYHDMVAEPAPFSPSSFPVTHPVSSEDGRAVWAPYIHLPDGYTSQPMSRVPSSNAPPPPLPLPAARRDAARRDTGTPTSPRAEAVDIMGSSSLGGSPGQSHVSRFRAMGGRGRSPSLVETEPSPRTFAAFDTDPTSYQLWEAAHGDREGSRQTSRQGSRAGRSTLRQRGSMSSLASSGPGFLLSDGTMVHFGGDVSVTLVPVAVDAGGEESDVVWRM